MKLEPIITPINPDTFEYQTYSNSDENLIIQSELDTVFSDSTDYIEYYVYDQNKDLIYPNQTSPLLDYNVREGDVLLNPSLNLESLGFDIGVYNISYSFYRKRAASSINEKYFISNISSDRTEIRLDSNNIENSDIISSVNDFIQYRETSTYFVDFYLNFGDNKITIANNIKLETEEGTDPTVLIKLYEPLPLEFDIKSELWVVELLSSPQAYKVDFPFEPTIEEDFTYIAGPNYNLSVIGETSSPGEQFSYNTLINSDLTSSINQIQSLLNEKEININIDYEDFGNFVNFSSAKTRLENFYYKVDLIQSSSNQLQNLKAQYTVPKTSEFSSSISLLTTAIDNVIKNFDGYEYFLYFNSGSSTSYPKSNTEPPFNLFPTGSVEAQTWLETSLEIATNYDENNRDWLYNSIPEYLRDDPANRNYELFVDMVGQYYDNVWTYTKDITNKFNADNRLDYGISKDLVSDAIKDFAIKLYSNNFNNDDLFTAFLGITPSGSAFPFPNITGSIGGAVATPTGYEYVDTKISASNDIVPLDDVNKSIYKRIYHNIPYLLKTKGTVAGLRALITSYGIPDTILRISEFGGKDRNESQDYDLKQNVFNYAFDTGEDSDNFISSSLMSNNTWDGIIFNHSPKTIQFRFKSAPIPTGSDNTPSSNIRYSQSLWSTNDGSNVVLEYTGSGFTSGSYQGSIPSEYDTYGTLKWIPANDDNPSNSASVYLPFFNEDWWSVQINISQSSNSISTSTLFAANEIDGKIGFSGSDEANLFDISYYNDSSKGYLNYPVPITLNNIVYKPFSGSFQELRYWAQGISESKFFDYVVNPYSVEGNTTNSTPNELMFRAALGTQLDTGSRISIHPRVTGSAVQITQSFNNGGSSFYLQTGNDDAWVTNVENIYQDQSPVGIKNRITDKIQTSEIILSEAPYGFETPTSTTPTISSLDNDTQTLSPMESMQELSFTSQSYTPNVDYLEVAFSPSNQINDDINAQLGYFNLGEFIGDPRFVSSSLYTYPDLDRLRNAYFEKYMDSYDVVDFVRLIKFFDNSLFKMIKDFTPARTSLSSGVVVKQHILERNRQRPAQASTSLHDYEGLVVNAPKNYSSGSSDFPQYSTEGSSIYKFSGGTGGSFERFNGEQTYISGSDGNGPYNRFNVTQSWQDGNDGSILNTTNFNQSSSQFISGSYLGPRTTIKNNQDEFYNGIFSGSMIIVTTQSLNPGCDPYLNANDTPVIYKPLFFGLPTLTTSGVDSVVTKEGFNNQLNPPPSGYAWIASSQTDVGGSGIQQVQTIKLSQTDITGAEVINYLDDFDNLRIIFGDATVPYNEVATEYIITGRTIFADHIILQVSQTEGNNYFQNVEGVDYFPITSSISGGSMNWSLIASTDFTTPLENSESIDNEQQGVFLNQATSTQEQNIYYWNGNIADALGFFNQGEEDENTSNILNPSTPEYLTNGSYTIPYTPNIPWHIKADIKYSSSLDSSAGGSTTISGIYHSGSSYAYVYSLTDQNFTFDVNGSVGGFSYNAGSGFTTVQGAFNEPLPDSSDPIVYFYNTSPGNFLPEDQNPPNNPIAIEFYSDTILTQQPPLTANRFYKFSNLQQDSGGLDMFFVIKITIDSSTGKKVGVVQPNYRNPSGKGPLKSIIDLEPSLLFRPAPKTVSGLGNVFFDSIYSTQIPGNSGSGDNSLDGGHPKFIVETTNTMDWNFDSLTLAGTAPTIGGSGMVDFELFSGSSYQLNTNFDIDVSGFAGSGTDAVNFMNIPSLQMGPAYDGSIFVKWNGTNSIASYIEDSTQNTFTSYSTLSGQYRTSIRLTADVSTNDTGANFTVQFCEQEWDGSTSFGLIQVLHEWNSNASGNAIISNTVSSVIGTTQGLSRNSTPEIRSRLFFRVKNYNNAALAYSFSVSSCALTVAYVDNQSTTRYYPSQGNYADIFTGDYPEVNPNPIADGFQEGNQNKKFNNQTAQPGYYPECVVNAYLKRTGSLNGIDYDYTITSSVYDPATGLGGYSGSIYSGSTIQFSESPITNISNDVAPSSDPSSTRANPGDMYYVEYEFTDFKAGQIGGISIPTQNIAFQSDINYPSIEIEATGPGGTSNFGFNEANVILRRSNLNSPPTDTGEEVLSIPISIGATPTPTGTDNVTGTYNGSFNANDIYRWSVEVDKGTNLGSGLVIQEFTASIFPGESVWSPTSNPRAYDNYRIPENTSFIVPTYYAGALPFNLALDCQPMLNNFILQRQSEYIMDVDYTNESGPIIPVNQEQILENKAIKAAVPDSNYTSLRSINPRYDGVKSTSAKLNIWSIGDTGTYGKNPTVELRDAFFGYFNDLDDPYPNINGLTRVNLSYLVDEQGNALPPSLEPITIDTFNAVFPNTTLGKVAVKDINSKYQQLGSPSPISRTMEYVTPICYSQNSGENYSNTIPLSGSGFISRYDNDDANDVTFAQFTAAGTASIDTNQQLQSVDYYLDPSETITQPSVFPSPLTTGYALPYSQGTGASDPKAGSSIYPATNPASTPWNVIPGEDLNNKQIISLQTSVVTTYVSETKRVRDELKMHLIMNYGAVGSSLEPKSFNLEYIDCKVYTDTGQVYLIKNVDEYGWFQYLNVDNNQNLGPRYNSNLNRWTTSRVRVPEEGIKFSLDWEMFDTLFDLGLMRSKYPKNGAGVKALEWIISANSGPQNIKANNQLNWRFKGEFKNSRGGYQQGYFFPASYEGAFTPTKIQGAGVNDHLLAEANTAEAPFWVFPSSGGNSFIEMASSNFNEAYGTGFYQGDLQYLPGTSQYFPGNVEPAGTNFDKIENPLQFEENDEIRFGNNENFTYRVLEVFTPQENDGKVKLRLDKEVDTEINKDFFLVRRKIVNPNSLYLDTPFPYGILSSGSISQVIMNTGSNSFALSGSVDEVGDYTGSISNLELASTPGILFPDFPTEYLVQSASVIVNDLISKGIIKS